jgi:hypothetical protein
MSLSAAASLALCGIALTSCTPKLVVRQQRLTGTFSGLNQDGADVVVTFSEQGEAFRGHGTVAGEAIAIAGPVVWRGVGSLVEASGKSVPLQVELSADGDRVDLLLGYGGETLVLERGGANSLGPPGPFSGTFIARSSTPGNEGRVAARFELVQSGTLISGMGAFVGDPVGVSALATGSGRARGFVTFRDGSQIEFRAELTADGAGLLLDGFGTSLTLERKQQ